MLATQKRYLQTEKGKAAKKRADKKCQKRYQATVNGHLHNTFSRMKRRCYNPNDSSYKNYGGRGIKVLFKSVNEFIDYVVDVLQQDPRGLTIDRIDSDGHYEPGNIWFCTRSQNSKYRGKDHFGNV